MIKYIYIFFVGLFLAVFIGMGVAVFYPGPEAPEAPNFYGKELTTEERQIQKQFDTKQRAYEKAFLEYNRMASILILTCAVIVLVIALLSADRAGVIAEGLLLGGIFTLLYGIGRGMITDSNKYRFLVAGVGLLVTLILGYIKFLHRKKAPKPPQFEQGSTATGVAAALVGGALMLGVFYGIYAWQHARVINLEQSVTQLRSDLTHEQQQTAPKPTATSDRDTQTYQSRKKATLIIFTPTKNAQIMSPLVVMGFVPGNWSFEGSFPIKLLDETQTVIAQTTAKVVGDWMSEKPVAFYASLTFSNHQGDGTLVLENDNPSGLSSNSDSVSLPIKL
ncbi:MAG TPA: Gmad2 immunoglobulin-like domain-containing protein [Patescibacteria group bacterium]|jgi:hypothetical protein|nr:Gmad2 immunoglobulin-like domain-containing protein [Patescibacteria group bacterium]